MHAMNLHDDGRFAIDPIEASLSEATAPAAEGHKVVCIFVNDTCDACWPAS